MQFDQKLANKLKGEIRMVMRFTPSDGLEVRVWSSPKQVDTDVGVQLLAGGLVVLSTKLTEMLSLGPATDITALGIDVSGDE